LRDPRILSDNDRMKLFLASTSPRRQQLLQQIGFDFEVLKPETDEIEAKGESPRKMVERFATEKALAALEKTRRAGHSSGVLISADTTVVSPDRKRVLNKPVSVADAKKMLRTISGKTHEVLTGYVICAFAAGRITKWRTEIVSTKVRMRKLSPKQIAEYVASGEPLDKAGSYGAQGIGMCLIEGIRGSYSNVVGLPMAELVHDLEKDFDVRPRWKKK
jgi:septum formation protein